MEKKQLVKSFISLVAIVASLYIIYNYEYQTKSELDKKIEKILENPSGLPIAEKTQPKSDITQFSKGCEESFKEVKSLISKNSPKEEHWKNYYLLKNGIEYVLRIEKDTNLQGNEVKILKFYKLDKDGFPTPHSKIHNSLYKNEIQIQTLIKGYEINEITTTSSFEEGRFIVETSKGKILSIKDQDKALECISR